MSRRWMTVVCGLAVLALGLVAAGCGGQEQVLEGTEWRLSGWNLSSLNPADFEITASFESGRVAGKSAVNQYSGPYTQGPGQAFSTGPLVSTLMAGPEPDMRAEQAYLEALQAARSFQLAQDTLTLYDEQGNVVLIFEAVSQ